MIYQHRIVIARSGKLEKRHVEFQAHTMNALDEAGSVLIGAWEVYIGNEAGSAVWQLRQFESMAAWEIHQDKVRADAALSAARQQKLYPHLDEINTSILRLADVSPPLATEWPAIDDVRGEARGYIEQRTIRFRVGGSVEHHEFYRENVMPALDRDRARLIGLFDTIIGDGTTNGKSMQSVELRHFPDLTAWQVWREAQDDDPALSKLIKQDWMPYVLEMHSILMRPLDYSRIR
jgi:hypothetical protein